MKIDKRKLTNKEYRDVVKELLESMHEEYTKGATAMWNHIRKEVSECYLKYDSCSICVSGKEFINKLEKKKRNSRNEN